MQYLTASGALRSMSATDGRIEDFIRKSLVDIPFAQLVEPHKYLESKALVGTELRRFIT
jgi:hypothetical protein